MKILNKIILINEKLSLWDIFYKYTFRDTVFGILSLVPASFGVFIRMLLLPIFFKSCGKGLTVKPYVTLKFPENLIVGDHVGIGEYSWIDANGGIEIGDYTRIGPNVTIASFEHKISITDKPIKFQGKVLKKTIIGDDVWIGGNSY